MLRQIFLGAVVALSPVAAGQVMADTATTAPATQAGARREPLEHIKDVLEKLNLTDDQKSKAKDILEDARGKAKALRDSAQGDREKMREGMRTLLRDTVKDLAGILNDEQKAKLKEMLQEGREARQGAAGK